MYYKHRVYLSKQGRTVVKFGCTDQDAVEFVNVSQHVHVDYDGKIGHQNLCVSTDFETPLSDLRVGNYNDWLIKPIVQLASQELHLVVPEELWWAPDSVEVDGN